MTEEETKPRVVIIGAGVVGCSIALALSKRGYPTTNVDKLPAAGYGSTSHSSAIVRPIYSHTTSAALAHESRHHWLRWQALIGPGADSYAVYHECGGMVLIPEGAEADYDDNLKSMAAVGVPFRIISRDEIAALYPGINLDCFGPPVPLNARTFGEPTSGRIGSALLVDAAGYVSDPQLAARNLQFAASQMGANFLFQRQVTAIHQNHVLLENGEQLPADIIVNAAGPHSGRINELAGVSLPIQTHPARHEVAYLPAGNQHFEKGMGFIADLDCGVYQRPDGADMAIGSTDPACDPEVIVDPDDDNQSLTDQWTVQAMRAAQRFPGLTIPGQARGTVGIYDVSDDWIPIYDRTERAGYYVAIGTSGNQFKNAPLIGEVMANIIGQEVEAGLDHDQSPATLYLEHLQRTLDLSFFSRHREVQATSGVLA